MTRNRFLQRLRQHRRALEREQALAQTDYEQLPTCHEPRPSEVAQADELWHEILTLCPPAHRELLRLKKDGLSLAELADRTGLHESSVRRILYDLAHRLAKHRKSRCEAPAGV